MTQETFDQTINSARRGDVFAQAVLGKMLCEGKDVQKNLPVKRLSHLTGQNFISSTRYYPRMPVINDWKKVLTGVLS